MRALIALTLMCVFATTSAIARDNFHSGNWIGAAYPENGGPFTHCAMYTSYNSGILMFFSIDRSYNFNMAFANNTWSLRKGDHYDISYRIDASAPVFAKANAISDKGVQVYIPNSAELFRRFKSGYVLTVDAVGTRFQFNLTGTYVALGELLDCTNRNTQSASMGSRSINPFLSEKNSPAGTNPRLPDQPATASADARVVAVAFIANLLNRAGLSQYEILAGSDIPESLRKYDVVWKGPEAFGMLNIVSPGVYGTVDQLASSVIAQDSAVCKGSFATGSQSLPLSNGVAMRQLFTACEGPSKIYLVYTLVPLKTGGFYNIIHLENGQRQHIDSANSQIAKILPAVMQNR
jgi:hypothetical protein